jgi:transposase
VAQLRELEALSVKGLIDLFYADESHFSSQGYVPYGWQFKDERVSIPVEKGYKINAFAMISRENKCESAVTTANIDSDFVIEFLDRKSLTLTKPTTIVLDNASVHKSKKMQERIAVWQTRGLYIVFLPTYSPELNIAETLWRRLKASYLHPKDYATKDDLFYAVNRCLANIGHEININFSPFSLI